MLKRHESDGMFGAAFFLSQRARHDASRVPPLSPHRYLGFLAFLGGSKGGIVAAGCLSA